MCMLKIDLITQHVRIKSVVGCFNPSSTTYYYEYYRIRYYIRTKCPIIDHEVLKLLMFNIQYIIVNVYVKCTYTLTCLHF